MTRLLPARGRTSARLDDRYGLSLAILRIVATGHLVAVFAQPVFAGLVLSGDYDMLQMHAMNAIVVLAFGASQFLASAVLWRRGRLRWPTWVSAGLALGETVQYEIGQAYALQLHLPLGVALITTIAITVVALWRPHTLGLL